MDLGLTFVARIIALQLVELRSLGFLVPRTESLKNGSFSNILTMVLLSLTLSIFLASSRFLSKVELL